MPYSLELIFSFIFINVNIYWDVNFLLMFFSIYYFIFFLIKEFGWAVFFFLVQVVGGICACVVLFCFYFYIFYFLVRNYGYIISVFWIFSVFLLGNSFFKFVNIFSLTTIRDGQGSCFFSLGWFPYSWSNTLYVSFKLEL